MARWRKISTAPSHYFAIELENQLQCELQAESFSRTDAWSAVVIADAVATETSAAAIGAVGRSEINTIEQVEQFDAELGAHPFGNLGVLDYRQIHGSVVPPTL